MAKIDMQLAEEVARTASGEISKRKDREKTYRLAIVCLSLLLAVAMVCGTVLACRVIIEQQYALNMQYASLMELVSGTEVTTETIDGSGGSVAAKIEGDGNTISGGELNGEN